ncbi:MAG: translocation/assembly module TamB domain-containing protein [Selenomonadaceae bacterium]|nr:translocation/assembly module TamB domain-containing protein [Selenomonadaceae bacterium]
MNKFVKVAGGILTTCALVGGVYINSQRDALIQNALKMAEKETSAYIGTEVKIGKVDVDELNLSNILGSSITIHDIEIFDRDSEKILTADAAHVDFKLFTLYDDPSAAIDEIKIVGAKANLKKRSDDSWNFDDIKIKTSGESHFGATVIVEDSSLDATFDGKNISVDGVSFTADCANLSAVDVVAKADVLGSKLNLVGTVGMENQFIRARFDRVDVKKMLPYLPEGTLPESLEIHDGILDTPVLKIARRGDFLKYNLTSQVHGGAVKVEETEVKNIRGKVTVDEKEVKFTATAVANGQAAKARGKVRTNGSEPFFDINAEAENFSPAAIIENIGVEGAADFTAHIIGTAKNPQVEADIFSPFVAYENFSAGNVRAHVNYVDGKIYLTDVTGETFGGQIAGECQIDTRSMAYNAHAKANGIDAAQILSFAESDAPFNGEIFADVALNGVGSDMSKFKIFGSAETSRADFQGFNIDDAKASFYYDENILKIDNLNAVLPNNGAIGVEGVVAKGNKLDLNFFASHVDLAALKAFNDSIDVSGLSDLSGKISGSVSAPEIALKLSAVNNERDENFKGVLFKQPYDSIKLEASGGLDNINVNKFTLERDGKIIWTVNSGTVGLTGDKKINLEVDTVDARLEDIVALVAPDQKLTGNISNKLRITGTLDNPNVVGNVHFKYGTYYGFLISGMEGEYSYENEKLRLKNFYVTSPMVDVVLDGTFDNKTGALDFVVEGKDISLKRIQYKLPENYHAEGHGTFEGNLSGTLDSPEFVGRFNSPAMNLNGVDIENVHGEVDISNEQFRCKNFEFNQGDGLFKMNLDSNSTTDLINGLVTVQNVDITSLLALFNTKNLPITGNLNSEIRLGNTLKNPSFVVNGNIMQGEVGGCYIHDVELEVTLADRMIYFKKMHGRQNEEGEFNLLGTINPSGDLDLDLTAKEIELKMFSGLAGVDVDVKGTANAEVKVGGNLENPQAEGNLTAAGSVNGAAFDLLKAHILFRDWVFDVQEFFVQRNIAEKSLKASAKGKVPIQSLYIDPGENLSSNQQFDLKISLNEADLTLLPVFDKYVEWAVGDVDGNLDVTGTLNNPKINGGILVKDGTIKLKFMSNPIEHFNISSVFKDDRFDLEQFTGNIGGGIFNLNGGFNFANFSLNGYNFNLTANELDIKSSFFNGPLNAEFSVTEEKTFFGILPKIAGHLDLDKCTISVPSIPDSDDPLPLALMDIMINLGDKVHLYSSHLYDMYLVGSAHFEGSTQHPRQSGTISVKRGGTLTYANSVFDIREGEASFNQMDSFFPSIHFAADTKFSRTQVFLNLDGSLNNMQVNLSSSPEMTQTEIINLLTLRENYAEGKGNITASDILAIGLQMSLLADVEDTVRKTLGFDQFRLTRGTGSAFDNHDDESNNRQNEFNIFIGKYISDKIMLRYTQGITGDKITRYGFQYDINDRIGFTVEREDGKYIFGLEAKFNF